MLRRCLLLLLIALALFLPRASRADDIDQDARRAAHKLGLAAMQEKNWEGAYDIYQSLWEERQAYDVALMLGQVELNLGRYRDAAEHLDFGIRHAPAREATELVKRAQNFFEEAKRHVGIIEVKVEPPKADILLDGMVLGVSPLTAPVFVPPGHHTLRAEYDGYEAAQQGFQVAAGETKPVALSLVKKAAEGTAVSPSASAKSSPSAPPPEPEPRSKLPAYIGFGVAGAALAVGVGFQIAALNDKSDFNSLRDETPPGSCASMSSSATCTELRGLAEDYDAHQNIATTGFVVGGVVAAGAITYLLWPQPSASRGTRSTTRVSASAAPDHARFQVSGSF